MLLQNVNVRTYRLEDLGVGGGIILNGSLRSGMGWGKYGLDLSGSGLRQVASSFKCRNESLGCIKCGKFRD
jgi:hypothetical protein